MDFYIKQRVLSWRDRFKIYDGKGEECFYAVGEVFTWGKQLHIYTMDNVEVAYIQQKVFSLFPKFYIYRDGAEAVEMVQRFAWFTPLYQLVPLGWTVTGDFWRYRYTITDDCMMKVAEVSRDFTNWGGDAYHIHIEDEIDAATVLAAVLVIDACVAQANNN